MNKRKHLARYLLLKDVIRLTYGGRRSTESSALRFRLVASQARLISAEFKKTNKLISYEYLKLAEYADAKEHPQHLLIQLNLIRDIFERKIGREKNVVKTTRGCPPIFDEPRMKRANKTGDKT
jgi:hypothetical protein